MISDEEFLEKFGETRAKFWGKIRADLRKRWMYSKIYKDTINSAKVPYVGNNKKKKYKIKCNECGDKFDLNEKIEIITKKGKTRKTRAYQVDHVDKVGSLNSFDDLTNFAINLFLSEQVVLCYYCHDKKTHKRK